MLVKGTMHSKAVDLRLVLLFGLSLANISNEMSLRNAVWLSTLRHLQLRQETQLVKFYDDSNEFGRLLIPTGGVDA